MTDSSGSVGYVYYNLDRLKSLTRGANTFSYGFDVSGNITSRTYPDSTQIGYGYDEHDRLASAISGGLTTSYSYDPAGRPTRVKHQTGASVWPTSFRRSIRSATRQVVQSGAVASTRIYGYDINDRLLSVCFQAGSCPGGTDPSSVGLRQARQPTYRGTTRPRHRELTYNALDELTQAGSTRTPTTRTGARQRPAPARSLRPCEPAEDDDERQHDHDVTATTGTARGCGLDRDAGVEEDELSLGHELWAAAGRPRRGMAAMPSADTSDLATPTPLCVRRSRGPRLRGGGWLPFAREFESFTPLLGRLWRIATPLSADPRSRQRERSLISRGLDAAVAQELIERALKSLTSEGVAAKARPVVEAAFELARQSSRAAGKRTLSITSIKVGSEGGLQSKDDEPVTTIFQAVPTSAGPQSRIPRGLAGSQSVAGCSTRGVAGVIVADDRKESCRCVRARGGGSWIRRPLRRG